MTVTKKQLAERQRRHQQLAAIDAAHRCGVCKAPLVTGQKWYVRLGDPKNYCSEACATDAAEASA